MATTTATTVAINEPPEKSNRWYRQLWAIKDTIIIIATPIVLLPILFVFPKMHSDDPKKILNPAGCAYTILIMIIYWMTEVLPMAVTSLIPVVLFPWLGVMSSKLVCVNYLKDANMLFFGGLLVAIAVEKWNLHKRVALKVLLLVGSKPIWIMFGFMLVTTLLSMWLNNTATTAMMMPIAHAVLEELDVDRKRQLSEGTGDAVLDTEMIPLKSREADGANAEKVKNGSKGEINADAAGGRRGSRRVDRAASDRQFMAFRKALKLSVPFASSIGGTGTLTGCGPNIVLKGQLDLMYPKGDTGINFTSWLVIGFPAMVIDMFGAWFILLLIFIGPKETFASCRAKASGGAANQVIRTEYQKLGSITFAEIVVIINFLVLAGLWFMREPQFIPGIGSIMGHKYVTDACLAITISVLLFILPSRLPNYLCFRRKLPNQGKPGPAPPILDWPTVNKQMPWSVILLLGGGFALADACKESGLSDVIGTQLGTFKNLDHWVIVLLMVLLSTTMTSFTSNMSTTTILIPIMYQLAKETGINPIYLMLPVTLAASWAYILPVSTPPNAIAYSYGDLVITDMIKAGLAMCALCCTVLMFSIQTWGYAFFNLGHYPDWAPPLANSTAYDVFNTTTTAALLSTTTTS